MIKKKKRSLTHISLGSFAYSSLEQLSSVIRSNGKFSDRPAMFEFKTGPWLAHSRTLTELSWRHSFVALAVLGFVVPLEDKPSPQTEVFSTLEHVFFFHGVSLHCYICLSLNPDESRSSFLWKISPQHDAATQCFIVGMELVACGSVPAFLQTWCLMEFYICLTRSENCLYHFFVKSPWKSTCHLKALCHYTSLLLHTCSVPTTAT